MSQQTPEQDPWVASHMATLSQKLDHQLADYHWQIDFDYTKSMDSVKTKTMQGFSRFSPEISVEYLNDYPEFPTDKSWQDFANCLGVNPDLFFPERGASTREAKAVCRACIVRTDCLEYALLNGEKFGIWGGMSEQERRRIRRQRALLRLAAGNDAPSYT